jgi:hypothetical protein
MASFEPLVLQASSKGRTTTKEPQASSLDEA